MGKTEVGVFGAQVDIWMNQLEPACSGGNIKHTIWEYGDVVHIVESNLSRDGY